MKPQADVSPTEEPELSDAQKLILDVLSALQLGIISGNITSLGIVAVNAKDQFGGVGVFAYPADMSALEIMGLANLYQESVKKMIFSDTGNIPKHPPLDKSKLN